MNEQIEFTCPYCGEMNYADVFIPEVKSQSFIQDCEVCCRPVEIIIKIGNEGNIFIDVKSDDGF